MALHNCTLVRKCGNDCIDTCLQPVMGILVKDLCKRRNHCFWDGQGVMKKTNTAELSQQNVELSPEVPGVSQ